MRIRVDSPIRPGCPVYAAGWLVLSKDDDGREYVEGVLPSKSRAEDYARSVCRGKTWRLLPVVGESLVCTERDLFDLELRLRRIG